MNKLWLIVPIFMIGVSMVHAQDDHRLGGGVYYYVTIDDLDSDIDEDGLSYVLSYQYRPTLLGIQLDAELLPDRFGEDAYAPAAYLVFGSALYASAGVGIVNTDGDWADDPFFALKAGLDLEVLPSVYLDISASYRFDSDTDLDDAVDDIDTDTVFLGAAVRLGF